MDAERTVYAPFAAVTAGASTTFELANTNSVSNNHNCSNYTCAVKVSSATLIIEKLKHNWTRQA